MVLISNISFDINLDFHYIFELIHPALWGLCIDTCMQIKFVFTKKFET